jgi:S-adenosylmethionine hydrolase
MVSGTERAGGVRGLITLLTDFGARDAYAGAMKGVIAGIAPAARVIDISHQVPPQDIRAGGLIWSQAVPYFPPGTVHVAVVDPGVGSRRRILAFEGRGSIFLAPDNGIIGHVLRKGAVRRAVHVARRDLFLDRVSATFHGRDIFAPVAARLALGLPIEALGPAVRSHRREELPRMRVRRLARGAAGRLRAAGEVIHVDVFGNAVTNLLPLEGRRLVRLDAGAAAIGSLSSSYAAAGKGRPLAIVGSAGFIEVSVNRGSAARELGLAVGDPVTAVWR